jgi:chromate transporter
MAPLASALVGALVTTFVTFLPCFVLVFAGAPYVEGLRAHRGLDAALTGVTAAVVGVVLHLALVLGGAILVPAEGWSAAAWIAPAVCAAAFLALWRLKVDVGWVVLAGGLLGLLRGILE